MASSSIDRVTDFFYDTVRTCVESEEDVTKKVAQLLEKYQPELLLFAIKVMYKRYPYSFTSIAKLEDNLEWIEIRYETIQVKKRHDRRKSEYDPENKPEANGPPEWIRKGIDNSLFK